MSDKCEWKDGKFEACNGFSPEIDTSFNTEPKIFCSDCGEYLHKNPEPEVIIRKSGGTWVALYDGVDYLCLQPNRNSNIASDVWKSVLPTQLKDFHWWKPISEIEITDEIAKLRPMVAFNTLTPKTGDAALIYSDKLHAVVIYGKKEEVDWVSGSSIRLATVSDLEES